PSFIIERAARGIVIECRCRSCLPRCCMFPWSPAPLKGPSMSAAEQPRLLEQQLEQGILGAVPAHAGSILHVHCGNGSLAAQLKAQAPQRRMFGILANSTDIYPPADTFDRLWQL